MASYTGSRQRQQSNLRAMEGIAKQAISKRAPGGGELLAPSGGAGNQNLLMGSGSQRNTRNRESYAHFRSWVYVCVDAIARRMASQAINSGEIENADENPDPDRGTLSLRKDGKRIYPAHKARGVPDSVLKYSASQQQLNVFESHPSLDLFGRPNSIQRKFEFLYMSCANLLLTGECYWIGAPDASEEGGPEVWAVPTTWITPKGATPR